MSNDLTSHSVIKVIKVCLSVGFSQIPPCNAVLLPSGASSKDPKSLEESLRPQVKR